MKVTNRNIMMPKRLNGGPVKYQAGYTIPKKYKLAGAEFNFDPNQYVGSTVPFDPRWSQSLAQRDLEIAMDPSYDYGFRQYPNNYGNLGSSITNMGGNYSTMNDGPVNKSSKPNQPATQSKPSQNQPYKFNPHKLNTYGNQISERALDRTTAFNLASSMLEDPYRNPLIVPKFEHKRQFVQTDFNPIYDQENVARRNISENQRSTAGMMGNLHQLNSNMVKAKMNASMAGQQQQRGLDAQFQGLKQNYADKLAVARQNVENLNKADEAEKRQYLSDTMTNWEKADQEKAKLYNAELATLNQMNTYVNQLSPEYKAVMGENGQIEVVFKSTGKPVPQDEFDKKKNAGSNDGALGDSSPRLKSGGYVNNNSTNNKKKLRTRLY